MKRATLLIAILALSACGTQVTTTDTPTFESEAAKRCANDCVLNHGGTIRGCSTVPAGVTGRGDEVKRCIDEADEALRVCYRTCSR